MDRAGDVSLKRCEEPVIGGEGDDTGARGAVATTGQWLASVAGCWWVLRTRARQEKRVAEVLRAQRIAYYLPTVPVRHTYAKSVAAFDVLLFPGYVFLCGDEAACESAWRTRRVAEILRVVDQARLRGELVHVERVLHSGEAVRMFPAIQPGRRCVVRSGPLKGVEGVVTRFGARCTLQLAVTMLSRSAVVELDAALLDPVA